MKNILFCSLFSFAAGVFAQNAPIPNTPSNGSDWRCLGPMSLPALGPGARPSNTGTGAEIRLKFLDGDQPNPKMLYACTPTGGLFFTRNALDSLPVWVNLTDSTRLPVQGAQDVEFLASRPETLYVATGIRYPLDFQRTYGIGVLKSTDSGRSWNSTGLDFVPPGGGDEVCTDILLHPENPDTVHVLGGSFYYRSVNGGKSFQMKLKNPHKNPIKWSTAFRDILYKPGSTRILYMTTDADAFYRSENGGETWSETLTDSLGVVGEVVRMDLAVSPLNPELVYLCCDMKEKTGTILRSLDSGKTWQKVFDKDLNTSYEKNAFALSTADENVLYLGGLNIFRLKVADGKATSEQIASSQIHMDHRDLLVVSDGKGGDIVYSANDGGLYRGIFNGKTWDWQDLSGTGLNNTQLYGIGVAEDFSVVPGGTQDCGIMLIYPDQTALKPSIGGDGTDCVVDHYDPKILYGVNWAIGPATLNKSTDGGLKWSRFQKGMSGDGDVYYYPLLRHESGYTFAATAQVFRLPHKGGEWEQLGEIRLPSGKLDKITAMAVAPSDRNFIYLWNNKMFRSVNGNTPNRDSVRWEDLSEGLGDITDYSKKGGIIKAIEVAADDPKRLWIAVRTYVSDYKIFYSNDGGKSWTNVGTRLPSYPVNALAHPDSYRDNTKNGLYAGTDVGIFYNPNAADPLSEWIPFNSGLPICIITDLEMNYCYNTLLAATFGRGVWASPLAEGADFQAVDISEDAVWNFKLIRSDVTVRKGATLTLMGEIRVATGKKIIVERGAKLVLDGAHIAPLCGQAWGGISAEKEGEGFFRRLFGAPAGAVERRNGATTEGME